MIRILYYEPLCFIIFYRFLSLFYWELLLFILFLYVFWSIVCVVIVDQSQCDASHLYYEPSPPVAQPITSGEVVQGIVNCFEYTYYKIQGEFYLFVIW